MTSAPAKPTVQAVVEACADALTQLQRQCLIAVNQLAPSQPAAITAAQTLFALQRLAEQAYGDMGLVVYNALTALVDEVNVAFAMPSATPPPALRQACEALRTSWDGVRALVLRQHTDRRMPAMHKYALQVMRAHLQQVGYIPRVRQQAHRDTEGGASGQAAVHRQPGRS